MTTEELSEYEQVRMRLHETRCRLTATMAFVRRGFCHRRACRRDGVCTGPMLVSPHQHEVVELHKELGLSGRANACLPACIAFQPNDMANLFKKTMNRIGKLQETVSDIEILRLIHRQTNDRSQIGIDAHLTSFARHPTSVAKQTVSKAADEKGMTP